MLGGVKGRLGSVFRLFTIVLLIVTAWTAYANVFSDDTDVRAKAGELARKEAGCGDKCKQTSMRGNRGMLEESIEYEMDKVGTIVVTCRRANIAFGDYACEAHKADKR
jgi:hypothetical protein